MKRHSGFTLIELLMVMAIMGIIAAFTVPAYGAMRQSVNLSSVTRQLVSAIREAQNKSITSQDNARFGLCFSGTNYKLLKEGEPCVGPYVDTKYTITVTGPTTANLILFTRLSGNLKDQSVDTIIKLGTKTIIVSPSGLVTVS